MKAKAIMKMMKAKAIIKMIKTKEIKIIQLKFSFPCDTNMQYVLAYWSVLRIVLLNKIGPLGAKLKINYDTVEIVRFWLSNMLAYYCVLRILAYHS